MEIYYNWLNNVHTVLYDFQDSDFLKQTNFHKIFWLMTFYVVAPMAAVKLTDHFTLSKAHMTNKVKDTG